MSPTALSALQAPFDQEQLQAFLDDLKPLILALRAAWDRGEEPDMPGFLELHPELACHREVVLDLAWEEYDYRKEVIGDKPAIDEFAARFPAWETTLCDHLLGRSFVYERSDLLKQVEQALAEQQLEEAKLALALLEKGQTFLGFSLQQRLGEGRLGQVFLARETGLQNRMVVVKISAEGGQAEAETLARLSHRNVVPIHSARHDKDTKLTLTCMPFLGCATLMEVQARAFRGGRYPGRARRILEACQVEPSLEGYLEHGVEPDPVLAGGSYIEGVLHLGIQLARALAFVHDRHILHQDLKPSNVLLTPTGRPMLLDFNLSADKHRPEVFVGGTLPYMAPEQLAALLAHKARKAARRAERHPAPGGQPVIPVVDARADLYSLGVILFELLAGRHPYPTLPRPGKGIETIRRYAALAGCTPRSLKDFLPRGARTHQLDAVLRRCLARDPNDRFASAAELDQALQRCLFVTRRARRWPVRALLVPVMLLALFGAADRPARQPTRDQLVAEGVHAYHAGNLGTAVDCFTRGLNAGADRTQTLFVRGRTYQKMGDWRNAVQDYLDADRDGTDGRIQACIGYCYSQMAPPNHDLARASYEQAREMGFKTAAVYNNLGHLWCWHIKGKDEGEEGEEGAEEFLHHAIQMQPGLAPAYANLVWLELKRAGPDPSYIPAKGMRIVREAPPGGPFDANFYLNAARLFVLGSIRQNDPTLDEQAFEYLRKALKHGADLEGLDTTVPFKDWPRAREQRFQELLRQRPDGPALRLPLVVDPVHELGD